MTIVERDYESLVGHLFSNADIEQAAYLLCRPVITDSECRLLVRKVIPVASEDIKEQDAVHMKIRPISFLRAMKEANEKEEVFFFVHSHPNRLDHHSPQDDSEEEKLFKTAYIRISVKGVHGSIIFTDKEHPIG
ncbi:MAG: Mov34/MPN/PAD-1 family protein, partial [Smithella sp.]